MNILHITTFVQGGAGRIIKDLASYQKSCGHNVFVITTDTEEPGYCNYNDYLNYFAEKNIEYFRIDSTFKRDIYLNLNVARNVRDIIIKENIDIIHAHAAVPAMIAIIGRAGMERYIPVIQTMHGWGTNKSLEHEKVDVTIMNGLDKIVSVSNSDKKLMINKGINEEKIVTIYNGIEEKKTFLKENTDVIEDISKYKKKGYKILGCIGTVCKRKNQELLIEAIKNTEEKLFCAFVGEGDILNELCLKVKRYNLENKVRFYGYRSNASAYIKYFDYLVLPSLSEGFGLVITEGFRERVPVIASDIEVFKEIISDNKNGYLFENNNVEALGGVIRKVLRQGINETDEITENAFKEYESKFKINSMLSSYDDLYLSILDKKGDKIEQV